MVDKPSLLPPNYPWKAIPTGKEYGGYLSIYYSDDMSRVPVRWITKPGDNKSDPNLETLTYGLFSTCSKSMRSGIVSRGAPYIFFAAMHAGRRVLTGYYHVAWYAVWEHGKNDYCLAADDARFIEVPIPLSEVDKACGTDLARPFRNCRLLSPAEALSLRKLIDKQPDARKFYLEETDRLERFNLRHTGYRYVAWKKKDGFSWTAAGHYLSKKAPLLKSVVKNSSPTGQWKCENCSGVVINKALLKSCPECGALGSLLPH